MYIIDLEKMVPMNLLQGQLWNIDREGILVANAVENLLENGLDS